MTAPSPRSAFRFPELHTLRFRLTAGYLVIFGVLQVILWLAVHAILNRHLNERFNQDLLRRGQTIAESFEDARRRESTAGPAEAFWEIMKPFEADEIYILAHFLNERRTVRSANLRGAKFPYEEPRDQDHWVPRFETLEGTLVEPLSGGDPLRLMTIDVDHPPAPFYLQLAANLEPLNRVIGDIQRLLLVFVVISLLIAAITSWFVATRSLSPIGVIARTAREFSTKRLSERIPVPDSGDEAADLVITINGMLDRLESQIKLQQAFIASASHELKTPLAILLGEVQGLRRRASADPEMVVFTDSLEEEIRKLLRIVETFLIMTRSRAVKRLEVVADVVVEETILSAIRKCRYEAKTRGVLMAPRLSADEGMGEAIVSGDADLITSMIENLLSNAIHHSPPGGTVEVEARTTFKEVHIHVRDQGPGIPEEHHSRIFEQGDQVSPEGKFSGKSGTGLAIVTAVVDVHGGSISVRNRESTGCEFIVHLPLAR